MKIIAFHGFLGGEEQFSFLSKKNISIFPINDYLSNSIEEISEHVLSYLGSEQGVLIGYSFGARLAMQVFSKNPEKYTKLILLSGHAGLETELERVTRKEIEIKFIQTIENLSKEEFKQWWNNLELFKGDSPLLIKDFQKLSLIKYFENWGLSKQPFLKNLLEKYTDRIHWYFGLKDIKYITYAKNNLSKFDVNFIEDQGHRVYQSKIAQFKIKELL